MRERRRRGTAARSASASARSSARERETRRGRRAARAAPPSARRRSRDRSCRRRRPRAARRAARAPTCMPMKPGRAGHQHARDAHSGVARAPCASARSFAYFMKLRSSRSRCATKPGDAVEEAEPAGRRSAGSARAATATSRAQRRALAARVHRLGLQRRVAVLLREVGVERLGRRVQQVAGERGHRAVGDDVLVHRVVGPARAAAVEQAHVPVGIAFAVREPAAEEAVAPRHRVGRRAAGVPARTARAIARASSGVTRSSASRHSTQSCARLRRRRSSSAARSPASARSIDARAASAARFPRYHRGCPNRRRRISPANARRREAVRELVRRRRA